MYNWKFSLVAVNALGPTLLVSPTTSIDKGGFNSWRILLTPVIISANCSGDPDGLVNLML